MMNLYREDEEMEKKSFGEKFEEFLEKIAELKEDIMNNVKTSNLFRRMAIKKVTNAIVDADERNQKRLREIYDMMAQKGGGLRSFPRRTPHVNQESNLRGRNYRLHHRGSGHRQMRWLHGFRAQRHPWGKAPCPHRKGAENLGHRQNRGDSGKITPSGKPPVSCGEAVRRL